MDMMLLITFLSNATVQSFFKEYLASKVLDSTLDMASSGFAGFMRTNSQKELIAVIDASIIATCEQYHWNYDVIKARTHFLEASTDQKIELDIDLDRILYTTFGRTVSREIRSFWINKFFDLLTQKKYEQAKDFFYLYAINNIYQNTKGIMREEAEIKSTIESFIQEQFEPRQIELANLLKKFTVGVQYNYELVERLNIQSESVIDRTNELNELRQLLNSNSFVYVGGMRGIGKKAFIRKFILQYRDDFNCIVYINRSERVRTLFADDSIVTIRNMNRQVVNDRMETDEEYYKRKIKILREIVDDRVLFIINDVSLEDDSLSDILSIGAKFILTTNDNVSSLPYAHILVEHFYSDEDLLKFFLYYYERCDISRDDPFLWKLFEKCQRHTLTVQLLACQMKMNHKSPKELFELLENSGFGSGMSEHVYKYENGHRVYKPAYEYIKSLFSLDDLSQSQIYIMEFLSLFTTEEIFIEDLIRWTQKKHLREDIDVLYNHGWVIYNEKMDSVSLHSVIAGVVDCEREDNIISFCKEINRIMKGYTDFELNTLSLDLRMYHGRIARVLIKKIEDYEYFYPFLIKAERALSYAQHNVESIELAKNIENWLRNKTEISWFEIGRMHYCIGWTYATQLRDTKVGLKCMEEGLRLIRKEKRHYKTSDFIQLSDIYGDISLVRARMPNGNREKALQEIRIAINYFERIDEQSTAFLARLSWLETFAAECCIREHLLDNADKWLEKAMTHVIDGPGVKSAHYYNVLYRIAQLLCARSQYSDALKSAIVFQSEYVRYYPISTPANIEHLVFIADLYYRINDLGEANNYIDAVLKISEKLYGKDSTKYNEYLRIKEKYGC